MAGIPGAAGRGILNISIKDKGALHAAYMPFLRSGGLFIATQNPYKLGDEVFMLLSLIDEPQKIAVSGRVVWITPKGAVGGRPAGVGLEFIGESKRDCANKIETLIAGLLQSDKPTHTL